jgi:PilZ domain
MARAKKAIRKRTPERRSWPRLPLAIPVFVRGVDYHGKKFQEFSALLNVSSGGALLATRTSLRIGTLISVEIPIPPWFL